MGHFIFAGAALVILALAQFRLPPQDRNVWRPNTMGDLIRLRALLARISMLCFAVIFLIIGTVKQLN